MRIEAKSSTVFSSVAEEPAKFDKQVESRGKDRFWKRSYANKRQNVVFPHPQISFLYSTKIALDLESRSLQTIDKSSTCP